MKKNNYGQVFQIFFSVIILTLFLDSCVSYKNIPYFRDVPDSLSTNTTIQTFSEPLIQYDDILSISINTLDLQNNSALNMSTPVNASTGGSVSSALGSSTSGLSSLLLIPASSTYRVDKSGEIEIALIGKFSVGSLTTSQVKDLIQKKLSQYYKMPTVDVRFVNFRITVLGEVLKPGTFAIANEKVTILDALGLSGDLTIFGRRDNIMLIRDSAEKKQMVRLNLNSKNLIASPYYYLKQNDVLYVEPTKAKIANLDAVQNRYIAVASSVLSILIILATRLR